MSSNWPNEAFIDEPNASGSIRVFESAGLPPPTHPAEADLFARHVGVPGHDQNALADSRILIVGGGGLGSWTALALARSGARMLTIVEPDRFDRTNGPRQLMFGPDLGELKALALSQNLIDHMVAGGQIVAIPLPFEQAIAELPLPADIVLFLVDNNACRFAGIEFARRRQIPAIFTMLSRDGMRVQTFLQGPDNDDACLHCALPNLDPSGTAPCAAATITSCLLAAAYTTFFTHRAVMGWPPGMVQFNWREADLLAIAPDRVGAVRHRPGCPTGHIIA